MKRILLITVILAFTYSFSESRAGSIFEDARINGSFQADAQMYNSDSAIGAEEPAEKALVNSALYLNISAGKFNMGMRYEYYLNPLSGFDPSYKNGSGLGYRFIEYNEDMFSVTAGNFYEQFGSGLIFRSYEERQLGIDNAVDGVRFKFRPIKGIEAKAFVGKQRQFWTVGEGIIRGGDLNMSLGSLFEKVLPDGYDVTLGGSFVSRYQEDDASQYKRPKNTLAYSTRLGVSSSFMTVDLEYAYKYNDPNLTNKYNYNNGYGFIFNTSIFTSGLGFSLNLHKVDNMDFRSSRSAQKNNLTMSFVAPLTKQQTFRLLTLYPYSTQLNGEAGVQAELTYTFPVKSLIGGDYGTTVTLNYSRVNSIDTTHTLIDTTTHNALTYDSPFFGIGNKTYFQEFNFDLTKKWSKQLKTVFTIANTVYDRDIMENQGAALYGKVNATAFITEVTYRFTSIYALRCELQHLWSTQDSTVSADDTKNGNWFMLSAEFTVAPHWYFTVSDEYNYGNDNSDKRLHYYNAAVTFINEGLRINAGWSRQRSGLICVGGVCRTVPASSGPYVSVSASF